MAVSQNTLIGRTRGSIGGVTFSKWKGLNVLKGKPEQVDNPRTIPQMTQRNRLSLMVEIYRGIPSLVQVGFKEQAINQSEYNAFVSNNIMSAVFVLVAPAVNLAFNALKVSKGPLSSTDILSAVGVDGSSNVAISFNPFATSPDQALSDLAFALVVNSTTDELGTNLGTSDRSNGLCNVLLPNQVSSGDTLECYLFFKVDGSDRVSDSVYIQAIVP